MELSDKTNLGLRDLVQENLKDYDVYHSKRIGELVLVFPNQSRLKEGSILISLDDAYLNYLKVIIVF